MLKSDETLSFNFWKDKNIKNILIVKLSAIGDVIMITPTIRAIKKTWPQAHVAMIVEKPSYPIVEFNENLSKVFCVNRKSWINLFKKNPFLIFKHIYCDYKKLLDEINKTDWDLIIDFQGLCRSAFFLYLVKAKHKAVWGKWLFYKIRYIDSKKKYAIDKYLDYANQIGLADAVYTEDKKPEIYINQKNTEKINAFITNKHLDPKKIVLINPISRWKTKNIPHQTLIKIIAAVKKYHRSPILLGTNDAQPLEKLLKEKNIDFFSTIGQLNLQELYYFISIAPLIITVDSASMHLASATQTKIIALFGPTSPHLTAPRKNCLILQKDIPCIKCRKKICKDNYCMDFSDEDIEKAVQSSLTKNSY